MPLKEQNPPQTQQPKAEQPVSSQPPSQGSPDEPAPYVSLRLNLTQLCDHYIRNRITYQQYYNELIYLNYNDKEAKAEIAKCSVARKADTIPKVEAALPPDMPPVDMEPDETVITEPEPTPEATTIINNYNCPEKVQCNNILESVKELLLEIEKAIIEHIQTQIISTTQPIQDVYNITVGTINVTLDKCEQQLGKAYEKALKPIRQNMSQCYGYLAQCGCCYPSPEQVVYGLETGNYMQSVGLQVPGDTTTTINEGDTSTTTYEGSTQTTVNETTIYQPVTTTTTTTQTTPTTPTQTQSTERSSETIRETERVEYYPLLPDINIQVLPDPAPPPPPPPPTPEPPRPDFRHAENPSAPWRTPLWDDPAVCRDLAADAAQVPNREMFGFYLRGADRYSPDWWRAAWGITDATNVEDWSFFRKHSYKILWGIMHGLSDASEPLLNELAKVASCNRIAIDSIFIKIMTGFLGHWTNGSLDGLFKGMEYKLNQSCPQQIPTQSELNALRLGGLISDDYWKCLTEANNNLPKLAQAVVMEARKKITYEDALMLYRLGRIDKGTYGLWAAANGVITEPDVAALESAAIDIPTVSDLIRMMVRDVGDQAMIDRYGLHDEFEAKWKGNLKTFGDAQGIDPEIAKLHWAAHWDSPSNTQAFEMLHRLRPDSPEIQALDQQSRNNGGKGVITTEDDIKALLAYNDMLPYWRDRMLATSYRPMTRTDAQRAYQLQALGPTPEENRRVLQGIYQDEGYNERDAKILVEFTDRLVKDRALRRPLPRGISKAVKYYLDGIHTIDQLEDYLNFLRVPVDRQADILRTAKDERKMIIYKNRIDCIRRSYMEGALDDVQAKAALGQAGMDAQLAIDNVDNWWCRKKAKVREVTAAKLCEWREKKIIDSETHFRRLVNLGYSVEDTERIVKDCGMDISQRAYDQMIREIKRQQAQVEKDRKEMEKQAGKAEKAARGAAQQNGKK